jgi:uncharacterized protein (DUF1778 family)
MSDLNIRNIDKELLKGIKKAALEGDLTMREWCLKALQDAMGVPSIRLGVEDQKVVAEALVNPPDPNDALRKAAARAFKKNGGERVARRKPVESEPEPLDEDLEAAMGGSDLDYSDSQLSEREVRRRSK